MTGAVALELLFDPVTLAVVKQPPMIDRTENQRRKRSRLFRGFNDPKPLGIFLRDTERGRWGI